MKEVYCEKLQKNWRKIEIAKKENSLKRENENREDENR